MKKEMTNEERNAKRLAKLTVNKIIRDFNWEIEHCEDMVREAKANQLLKPDGDVSYEWTIEAYSKQAEGARKALKNLRLCYAHLSPEERDIPLVNQSLSPNMVLRMEHELFRSFRDRGN